MRSMNLTNYSVAGYVTYQVLDINNYNSDSMVKARLRKIKLTAEIKVINNEKKFVSMVPKVKESNLRFMIRCHFSQFVILWNRRVSTILISLGGNSRPSWSKSCLNEPI